MAPLRIFAVITVLTAAVASAQDVGPKSEPSAMSSNYNPLMWHGDVADFAVYTEHTSFCEAGFSREMAGKLTDSNLLSAARLSAAQHEHIYRQLRSMAKALDFAFPPKAAMQDCPDWRKSQNLEEPELTKAWVSYLSATNNMAIGQFQALIAHPEKPDNAGLRKMAEKALTSLQELQGKLNAGEAPAPKQSQ